MVSILTLLILIASVLLLVISYVVGCKLFYEKGYGVFLPSLFFIIPPIIVFPGIALYFLDPIIPIIYSSVEIVLMSLAKVLKLTNRYVLDYYIYNGIIIILALLSL